ncbi:hypothetical protein AB0E69_05855 [Kribbella sp. NPDC026611]|uniref:hypothetical protein n=1 Tax=Kribbella sp. NPDC026611 TaxID=3154911 RepID=UPI0033FF7436
MSIHPEANGAIEVRTEPDGAVVVGTGPVGAAGLVFIALDGGVLAVDPMAPFGPGQLRVSHSAGPRAVEAVYGAAAAAAVARAARDQAPVRIPLRESPIRDNLIRLGVLRWLRDRCPVAIDRSLLIVEEQVLAARLADVLDAEPDALLAWAPAVLEWARACRRTESEVGRAAAVPHLVVDALAEIQARLAPDSLLLADVQLEAKVLRAWRTPERRAPDAAEVWAVIEELSPHGTQLARPDDGLTFCGRGPVDWDRTPATATSRAEDAVSWRIVPQSGRDLLTVVVEAFPQVPQVDALMIPQSLVTPSIELQAALYQREWPLPLAVVELTMRPENGALMGSARLEPAASARIRSTERPVLSVEVQPRGTPVPPRPGADARCAAAMRWASRGLSSLRLASIAPPGARDALRNAAADALAAAARRYSAMPDRSSTAAAAQCARLIRTMVEREPWTGPARASAAELWYAVAPPLAPRPTES